MPHAELKRTIMRRVYYAYAFRIARHPITTHGTLIAVSMVALTHFISIPNIWANMLNKKLGEVHIFLFESAMSTEIWTFVLVGLMLTAVGSLIVQLRTPRFNRTTESLYST